MSIVKINNPVFVRGLSRSGGTFLCTMLDAHPNLAISYELYPGLLEITEDQTALLESLLEGLGKTTAIKKLSPKAYPSARFRTFFIRLERGGVTKDEAIELIRAAIADGIDFSKSEGRGEFMERCCEVKSHKLGKEIWGCKMNNQIPQYLSQWPNARCIDIVRDGRDVAASQLKMGTFGKTVEEIANAWHKTHTRFLRFQESHPHNVKVIRYEDLIHDSEENARALCDFIGIPYNQRMLNYHKEDLTLFKANHISKSNVMSGINAKSIGKWKAQLSVDEVAKFADVAGDTLRHFNYL